MRSAQLAPASSIITVISRAVLKAARGLLRDFGELEHIGVSRKGPHDFVTTADLNAEKILVEELRRVYPAYGFLTEERGALAGDTDCPYRWVIDPLDGTHNYLHGFPYWAISVALEKNGQAVAGVVYDPLRNELFHAEKGSGAYLNNQRLRIRARQELSETLVAFSCVPFSHLSFLVNQVMGIRKPGAIALNLAYLAAGRFDACLAGKYAPWDTAAGTLLVQEAGGIVTDATGQQELKDSLIAANINLHEQLMQLHIFTE
ncbi:MAG: inositol monophosphatase [Holosporales bacterium]|jgi:myo-inositol-1(or 4)-monophosphatase|nr:inositol monophosphatase [Holosporales bacterium]